MTSPQALALAPPSAAARAPAAGAAKAPPRALWLRAAGPLLLLLAEVGALTPWVEFSGGALQHVASPRVCSGLLFALVAFVFLAAGEVGPRLLPARATSAGRPLAWLAANLGLYALFFRYTLWLEAARFAPPWVAVPAWLLLAAAVGLTAFLAFFPLALLRSWVGRCRGRALFALALGGCLVLLTPAAQRLWPRVAGPALAINRALLVRTYGHALTGRDREGVPVVGTQRLLLLVTPQCSELDALAAFGLLAGATLCARWREARKVRLALVVALGAPLLYALNAGRIYGLVVVGLSFSPKVCVSLAHSRVGGALLLAVTAALLSLPFRPPPAPATPAAAEGQGG